MAKDITLKDKNGGIKYPKTVTAIVYENGTGKTLQTIIDEMRQVDAATNTRTQHFKADVNNLDTLKNKTDIGLYNYVGTGWRGSVSVCYDSADNVSQVALSSSTPSYNGNTLTWISAQPCAMARTYRNGAWSHWEKVGAPVVNDLTTGGTDKALSAEMGKELKSNIDALGPKISESGIAGDINDHSYKFSIADEAGNKIIGLNSYIKTEDDGTLKTKNFDSSSITGDNLADGAISEEKIEDGAVSEEKLSQGLKDEIDNVVNDGDFLFSVSDSKEGGNKILALNSFLKVDSNGNIKTKNFDSSTAIDNNNLVICMGDSLTAVPSSTLDYQGNSNGETWEEMLEAKEEDFVFSNQGVGGEETLTILGRLGIVPYAVGTGFTIPATPTATTINIVSSWLDADGNHMEVALSKTSSWLTKFNPVYINGIKGNISIESETTEDDVTGDEVTTKVYKFTRLEAGYSSVVAQYTPIVMEKTSLRPKAFIVWCGTNDDAAADGTVPPFDAEDYVEQIRIACATYNTTNFIVMSPCYTTSVYTSSVRQSQEKILQKAFGSKYINLRSYLSTQGIYDAKNRGYIVDGQTTYPTADDLTAMQGGNIPPTLLKGTSSSDKIHFCHEGYLLIADMIHDRMKELGYFNQK